MPLADYHTHTVLCHHATGSTLEYVEHALRAGLEELGFSCHSPMPAPIDDWRMDRNDLPRYLEMVTQAQAFGESRGLSVKLGLEVDYFPGQERWIEELTDMADWDYLIGSVHYIGDKLAVDDPRDLGKLGELPVSTVWDRYWTIYAEGAATGLFDFMGHPDLPKKFGQQPPGDLATYYQVAIDAMARADVAFEINTGGLRKPVNAVYPAPRFLELAHRAGLELTINSDAHAPEEVGADFEYAVTLAREAGYTHLARFTKRRRELKAIA